MHNTPNNRGYTLIEVMIAITIGLVLIAATSATYIVQTRSSVMQESVSETNTQSKIAGDLMSGEIRSAGFGISVNLNSEPVNGFTTVITPVDNDSTPDAITVVGGFRLIGTLWPAGSGTVVCPAKVEAGSTTVRIVYSGTDGPNTTDKRYLSIDGIETVQVSDCTMGTDGRCESDDIKLDRGLTQDFPLLDSGGSSSCAVGGGSNCVTGRPVYLIEDTTFCVDSNNTLRRIRRGADPDNCAPAAADATDNDAIAENIEDLQIAYAIDENDDGLMDDQNGDGDFDGDDFIIDADDISDFSTIMAFRINLLARADRTDENFKGMGNPPSTIENRNFSSTDDDYRRRWWRTVVTLRNQ